MFPVLMNGRAERNGELPVAWEGGSGTVAGPRLGGRRVHIQAVEFRYGPMQKWNQGMSKYGSIFIF